jgi:ATP/maltotriose-dependent transcriptional regulator MalT
LLCEGLERLPEAAREEFLTGDLTEKFKGNVFKYFGEQVFAALPSSTKEFLVKSTILDVVDPDFIKSFLGIENTGEILEDQVKQNLLSSRSVTGRKDGSIAIT